MNGKGTLALFVADKDVYVLLIGWYGDKDLAADTEGGILEMRLFRRIR